MEMRKIFFEAGERIPRELARDWREGRFVYTRDILRADIIVIRNPEISDVRGLVKRGVDVFVWVDEEGEARHGEDYVKTLRQAGAIVNMLISGRTVSKFLRREFRA